MAHWAAQLGFAVSERLAVLHADDIGLCNAANAGAFEALEEGVASAGSVMVPCPAFEAAARHARRHPSLDLGVHLTLNCEFSHYRWGPVADPARVPTLLAPDGGLRRTSLESAAHAQADQVEIELRAQIDRALDAGIDVTHLDAHMGTALYPPFVEVYVRLGREYRLPVFAVHPDAAKLRRRGLAAALPVFERILGALQEQGFPIFDDWDDASLNFERGRGEEHNLARLEALRPGVTYVITHPATDGEELRRITPETAHARAFEYHFYAGDAGHAALRRAGVRTVGMRPLRALLRGEGPT